MDTSNKALARRLAALEKKLDTLLRDAPWKQNHTSKTPENTSDQEHDCGTGEAATSAEINPTPSGKSNSKNAWYKTLQWWKSRIELIGILFAIGYAIVTYYQWRDLRNHFMVDQRAWVKVGFVWPDLRPDEAALINGEMTNVGKSTITRIIADGAFEVLASTKPPSFSLKQRHSTTGQGPLFPADSNPLHINLFDQTTRMRRGFTSEEIQSLVSGKAYIATFGMIAYWDQFGVHWYRFCNWHSYAQVDSTADAAACVSWNTTGDGIPKVGY